MSFQRADNIAPCVSKRGVVAMGYGVIYPTHGGLAIYSPATGSDVLSKAVYDWDQWNEDLDPSSIVANFYQGKYFASHTGGSFLFG